MPAAETSMTNSLTLKEQRGCDIAICKKYIFGLQLTHIHFSYIVGWGRGSAVGLSLQPAGSEAASQ